jgi:TRAP-type C4-dicarboxylate transport system substrate-binding protein
MKKAIALALVLVLCFAMLAGCGNSNANTNATDNTPASDGNTTAADTTTVSDGKVYNLTVVNHDASTSMCEAYIETLCKQIEEASGGRLTFTFYPGGSLLGATETMDGVKDGAADICWSATSFFGKRFPISEFINVCANGITSARMGTDVYQQMYEEIPELQAELGDWKILALHSCSYGPVSTVGKKIEKAEDFKGLQIRTAGTIAAQYITALGATPVTIPTSDVYEGVSKGVFDGFTNDWHNIDCFKLYEPIEYCLDLPISYTSCFVMMNKDTYAGLPADLQAIIDEFADGYAGDMAGYYWDSCNYWVADKMRDNGVEVYKPSDELYAWATSEEIVGPIHQWYIEYLDSFGLDGQAIWDKCMEIVAENTEAHANDWDAAYTYTDWPYTTAEGYNG